MKKILVGLSFLISSPLFAQNSETNIQDYLVLGVEVAQEITGIYISPLSEGLMYGLTGGWYNSAVSDKKWSVDFSIVSNGSFVPSERLSEEIDLDQYDNLSEINGRRKIRIATILGSRDEIVTFVATLNDEEYEFDAPTGIGLFNANFLPTAFLQSSVGLPFNTEAVIRFIPKINIDEASAGVFGFGVKNEVSRLFSKKESTKLAVSAMIAFNALDADYQLKPDEIVGGENHRIEAHLETWMFEMIASTNFPVYNFYGGLGFVTGTADYDLKGRYFIENETQDVLLIDPFSVRNNVDGFRLNFGGKVRMGWFSLNLDYTFQGFNNLSLGLNFDLYNKTRVPKTSKKSTTLR